MFKAIQRYFLKRRLRRKQEQMEYMLEIWYKGWKQAPFIKELFLVPLSKEIDELLKQIECLNSSK